MNDGWKEDGRKAGIVKKAMRAIAPNVIAAMSLHAPLAPISHAGWITQWIHPWRGPVSPRLSGQVSPSGGVRGSVDQRDRHMGEARVPPPLLSQTPLCAPVQPF